MGLAWFRTGDIVWHGGNMPGYAAFVGVNKEIKKDAVILINSAGTVANLGMQLLESQKEAK